MKISHSLLLMAVTAVSMLAAAAQADSPLSKAEQTLKYRKSVFQVMAWNFGPMGAMAQGKVPYDAAEFTRRAERVAAVAPMLTEAFPPETKGLPHSELKPEMWSNRADFDAKLKDLVDRSATLAQVSKGGDAAKTKAAFFDMANTCKACHDKYKED
jgi:cytochrome c556